MILISPVSSVEKLLLDNSPRFQSCSKVVVGMSMTTVKREVHPVNRMIPRHPRKIVQTTPRTSLQVHLKKVIQVPQKVILLLNPPHLHPHPQPNRPPATEY